MSDFAKVHGLSTFVSSPGFPLSLCRKARFCVRVYRAPGVYIDVGGSLEERRVEGLKTRLAAAHLSASLSLVERPRRPLSRLVARPLAPSNVGPASSRAAPRKPEFQAST